MTAPASTPAPAAPSTLDMICAILAVQTDQAVKIGAARVALNGAGETPLVITDLAAEVEILAGLDLALTALQSAV